MGLGDELFDDCIGRHPARRAYPGAIGTFRRQAAVPSGRAPQQACSHLADRRPAQRGVPVDVGSLVVSGTKIMMQQPRLAGFTRDNRRYNMIAQAAAQDVTKPDMIELHGINATMEMKDGAVFETTAKDGLYNSKTELLTLSQNIVVTSSSGYKALLNEAVIDVRAGRVISDKPVEVKTATWTINANGMEVADSGDVMRFDRGVFVTMMLEGGAKPVVTSDGRKP
jgi:lipopolysaccharide export system protein LptC